MPDTAIKERPILFSSEIVKAILDGRKTQTRRVIKPQPPALSQGYEWGIEILDGIAAFFAVGEVWSGSPDEPPQQDCSLWRDIPCPYGQPGDRLWVRESFYLDLLPWADGGSLKEQPDEELLWDSLYYLADGDCCEQIPECACAEVGKPRWRRARFMPRWASRITLEVTDVRVERLQDISGKDAIAEGCMPTEGECWTLQGGWHGTHPAAISKFRRLWDSINTKPGIRWDGNPWCWIVEFRKLADAP